ncbi:MAG: hypothetical protein QOK20_1094, partial [Acidimicrobiaceae bacterium]|nr:hypothetical protein [Acidimicrobiaceae bacterium]
MNISGNSLTDNWGGVTLWENADRFCGSPANTSATFCTMGNPTAANFNTCVAGTINNQPYLADCRWKTQNVAVHDNQMAFSRANVGCSAAAVGCGVQAIVSNWGTSPTWSPYLGSTIIDTIATQQNNHSANNTYTGDWTFSAGSGPVSFSSWQSAPNNQDTGSTLNGSATGPPPPANALDSDTSTLEGSVGHWIPWFSSSVAQNATQAQSGTHSLQVNITAPYGWGVQTDNWPGFDVASGAQTVSFWGSAPLSGLDATMNVQWRDSTGNTLGTSTITLGALTGTWQQAKANVTAPAGTAKVGVTFSGTTGIAGNSLFLDQITVGPGSAVTPPPPPGNLLDADTATLERSVGRWVPWFSAGSAQSTAQAKVGTHSLRINITAANGWGVQLNGPTGIAAAAGPKNISFWAKTANKNLNATLQVQWRDANGNSLGTTSATLALLKSSWLKATATGTAPAGTTFASVTLTGTTGVVGNLIYVDQFYVGS